jgi:hypothetical protein
VDLNAPGADKIKSLCKLPVYEPGGALNRNAVHAAAARFGQTRIPTDEKKKAARKLIARYRELDEDVPDSIMVAAGVR